jgi:hypothetical protein
MIDRPARVLASEHKLVVPVHGSRIFIAMDVQVLVHGRVRVRVALAWTHDTAGMGCKGDRHHVRKVIANNRILHGEEAVDECVEIEPSIWMMAAHVNDQATFCWTRRHCAPFLMRSCEHFLNIGCEQMAVPVPLSSPHSGRRGAGSRLLACYGTQTGRRGPRHRACVTQELGSPLGQHFVR